MVLVITAQTYAGQPLSAFSLVCLFLLTLSLSYPGGKTIYKYVEMTKKKQ